MPKLFENQCKYTLLATDLSSPKVIKSDEKNTLYIPHFTIFVFALLSTLCTVYFHSFCRKSLLLLRHRNNFEYKNIYQIL